MLLVLLSVQGHLARLLVNSTISSAAWAIWPTLPYPSGGWQKIQGMYLPSKGWLPGICPWNSLQKPVPVWCLTQPGEVPHLLADTLPQSCWNSSPKTTAVFLSFLSFRKSIRNFFIIHDVSSIVFNIPLLRVRIPWWPFPLIQMS